MNPFVDLEERNEQVLQENLLYAFTAEDFRASLEFLSQKTIGEMFVLRAIDRAKHFNLPITELLATYSFKEPNCSEDLKKQLFAKADYLSHIFNDANEQKNINDTSANSPKKSSMDVNKLIAAYRSYYDKFHDGQCKIALKTPTVDTVLASSLSFALKANSAAEDAANISKHWLKKGSVKDIVKDDVVDELKSRVSLGYVNSLLQTGVSKAIASVKSVVGYLTDEPDRLSAIISSLRAGQYINEHNKSGELSAEEINSIYLGAVESLSEISGGYVDKDKLSLIKSTLQKSIYKPNEELKNLLLTANRRIQQSYLVDDVSIGRARYFDNENTEFLLAMTEYTDGIKSPQIKTAIQSAIIAGYIKHKTRRVDATLGEVYHVVSSATANNKSKNIEDIPMLFDMVLYSLRGANLEQQLVASGRNMVHLEKAGQRSLASDNTYAAFKSLSVIIAKFSDELRSGNFKMGKYQDELSSERAEINKIMAPIAILVSNRLGEDKEGVIISDIEMLKLPGKSLYDSIVSRAEEGGFAPEEVIFGFASLAVVSGKIDMDISSLNSFYKAYIAEDTVTSTRLAQTMCQELEMFKSDKTKCLGISG